MSQTSNAEDELDLDSVLEQHDDAAVPAASMSVLDAHEEPTRPGPKDAEVPEQALESIDDVAPIEEYAEQDSNQPLDTAHLGPVAEAALDSVSATPARVRRSTGTFPPQLKSPFEEERQDTVPPVQAAMPTVPSARPMQLPGLPPAPSPAQFPPAPAIEESAFGAPGTTVQPAPGTITMRRSKLVALTAGTFAAGIAAAIAISSLVLRPATPVAAPASVTAAQPTPAAAAQPAAVAEQPSAAPAPVATAPAATAAPVPAAEAVAAPEPAAAPAEPAAAPAVTEAAAKRSAGRARGARRGGAPEGLDTLPEPGATAKPAKPAEKPAAKGKQDWDDPFVK